MDKKLILTSIGLIFANLIYTYVNAYFYFIFLIAIGVSLIVKFNKKSLYFLAGGILLFYSVSTNMVKPDFEIGQKLYIKGEVVKTYEKIDKFQRVEIKTDNNKFSVSTIGDEKYRLYDNVEGIIQIQELNGNYNFDMFNLEKYQFLNSIDSGAKGIELRKSDTRSFIKLTKLKIIEYVENIIDLNLTPENSSIIKKLILSNPNLDDSIQENFSQGGIAHLLAISGLHIYIIIGFFDILLRKLKINYHFSFGVILISLLSYAFILNFPPSVVRAILMYMLLKISEIFFIKTSKLSILLMALIIQLTVNPRLMFDLGFQLSYLSLLGIVLLKDKFFDSKDSYILKGINMYLSANIFILPILIYNFNNFNLASLGINLFATPLITIVLILSYIGIIISPINILSNSIFLVIGFILDGLNYYLELILENLGLSLRIFYPTLGMALIYYIFLFLVLSIDYKKIVYKHRNIFGLLASFFIANILVFQLFSPLIVGFYDVGQGDSAYLLYKNNFIQIDTGGSTYSNYNPGEEVTAKATKKRGITIDLMILSHFDNDHVLGVPKLIDDKLVKGILINKKDDNSAVYKKIEDSEIDLYYPPKNKVLNLDKNLEIEFLNTNVSDIYDSNDSSLVLLVKYKDKKILFTGDISSKIENKISKEIGKVDILKVSHHGSESSTDMEFLYSISPEYSVISVGKNNSYGHPSKKVIDNLNRIKSEVLRTDELGEIVFYIDKDIFYRSYRHKNINFAEFISIVFSAIIGFILSYYIIKEEEMNEIQRF